MYDWIFDANSIVRFLLGFFPDLWNLIRSNWILMLSFVLVVISFVVSILKSIRDINRK